MPEQAKILTPNFIIACATNFASFSSFYFLLATLPVYIVEVGGSESETGFIIGAFAITALLLRPFVGQIADRRGRKLLVLSGAGVLVASGLLYNTTTSVSSLLALRVFHGAGWAAVGTGLSTLIADIAPEARRGEAVGYYGMSTNLAMSIGPALGVVIQRARGFPTLFFSSAAAALMAVVLSLSLSDPFKRDSDDPPGGRVFLERSALFPSLVLCLMALSYASIISFLPLFAAKQGIENPGLFFTIFAVVIIGARGPLGRLSDRRGRGTVIVPGLIALAAGLAVLAFASSLPLFSVVALLYGAGFAAVQPALMAFTIDRVRPESKGAAMGTYTAAMDLGIGVGSFLWGFVAQFSGFSVMYLSAGGVAVAAAIAFLLGCRQQGRGKECGVPSGQVPGNP